MIKRIFGNSEEMLLEILLNLGQASASNVIFHSAKRLKEANGGMFASCYAASCPFRNLKNHFLCYLPDETLDPSALHQGFLKLAQENFIIRCPKLIQSIKKTNVPTFEIEEKDLYTVPHLELAPIGKLLKENAIQLGEHADSEIIWRVNHDRFDVEMR